MKLIRARQYLKAKEQNINKTYYEEKKKLFD